MLPHLYVMRLNKYKGKIQEIVLNILSQHVLMEDIETWIHESELLIETDYVFAFFFKRTYSFMPVFASLS